jgi:hypothetical protein
VNDLGRKRGKLPYVHDPAVMHYSTMRAIRGTPIPPIPPSLDWMHNIDRAGLGTLGNAPDPEFPNEPLVGDCGVVGMYRFIQTEMFHADPAGVFPSGSALTPCAYQAYHELTGWVANNPASDTGIMLLNGLKYWMNTGLPMPDGSRHKISGFFKLDQTNDAELREAVALCGGIYVGQDIPTPYDYSQPGDIWDVEGEPAGGHCTDVMSFDPTYLNMESWALRFPETAAAKNKYMDEAWTVVSATWVLTTGKTPFNMTLDEVDAAMAPLQVTA